MWTRKELKMRGKAAFRANYWRCVLTALVLTLLIGGAGIGASFRTYQDLSEEQSSQVFQQLDDTVGEMSERAQKTLAAVIVGAVGSVMTASFILSILIFNPLVVGCQRFFRKNCRAPASLDELGYGFTAGYGRVVKTMLLTDVFLILWTCLFVIPGLVKSYSYRMVPFILSDEPTLSGREAIDRSREMMDGHKWRAFVLDLSFILWDLLSIVTLGLAEVFYVAPYRYATGAELYRTLKGADTAYDDMAYASAE